MTLSLPLNKRNTRDKAKGLCITSERPIGELGVRCLSTLNGGQESKAAVSSWCSCCFFIFVVEYAISIKTHTAQP